MRLKSILILTLFSALSGSLMAQQPEPAPPPPSLPAPKIAPAPGQRKMVRDIQIVSGNGVRSDARIAPPGIWWKNPDLTQKLNITPDQQKRMDDIFQQSRIQLIDLKANVEKQEVLLEPMLDANPPDTNKVLAQIDHVAQSRAELEKANARMLLGIRGVLTPEQWTKLQAEQRGNRRIIIKGPGGPEGPEGMVAPLAPGGHREVREFYPGPGGDNDIDISVTPPTL